MPRGGWIAILFSTAPRGSVEESVGRAVGVAGAPEVERVEGALVFYELRAAVGDIERYLHGVVKRPQFPDQHSRIVPVRCSIDALVLQEKNETVRAVGR